jgi:GNAT superfamily N-acetyltransferase
VVAYAHIFPPAAPKPTTEALTPSWTDVLIDPVATVIVAEDAVIVDRGPVDGRSGDRVDGRAGGRADGRAVGRVGGVVGGVVVRAGRAAPAGFLLERLYVDPSRWGTGIGGLLHDEAVRAARQRGARRVNLWVLLHNHRAREMYERRGWRLVAGEQLAHTTPPITEVRYELVLPEIIGLPDDLPDNKEGPAGGSRSFVSRETMLGGTCSTSTTLSVGERALFDHRAIRPIRRLATATRRAWQTG